MAAVAHTSSLTLLLAALVFPPLAGAAPRARPLRVKGFRAAVHVPAASTAPRRAPVLVVLHGNFDRPGWECDAWRGMVAGRAFLLCPRGRARSDSPPGDTRYTYVSSYAAAREIRAGLRALARRYGERVDTRAVVLGGFSLGATFAARIAWRAPRRYRRLLLVEGGHTRWSKQARRFFRRGGRAVVFGCGAGRCLRNARAACRIIAKKVGKGRCRRVYARIGHSYVEPLPTRVRPHFDRLLLGPLLAAARKAPKKAPTRAPPKNAPTKTRPGSRPAGR